jgi:putative OPT family oligopeptide transporter
VLIGHWHGFPFWQTTAVCLVGGLIGLVYSIPLRRALVMGAGLPYPEGTAAAEVLHAGEAGDRGGLRILLGAAGAGGLIGLATTGFRLLAEGLHTTLAAGPALFRFATGFSPALVGVGYLVGLGACLALLAGVALAWGVAVPLLTAFGDGAGTKGAEAAARAVWSEKVRLIGAGIIAVGAVWTVASLGRSILGSIRSAFRAARGRRARPAPAAPSGARPADYLGRGCLAPCSRCRWLGSSSISARGPNSGGCASRWWRSRRCSPSASAS